MRLSCSGQQIRRVDCHMSKRILVTCRSSSELPVARVLRSRVCQARRGDSKLLNTVTGGRETSQQRSRQIPAFLRFWSLPDREGHPLKRLDRSYARSRIVCTHSKVTVRFSSVSLAIRFIKLMTTSQLPHGLVPPAQTSSPTWRCSY